MFLRKILFALPLALAATVASAQTTELSLPEGPIVLTVSGDIAVTNADDTAIFDVAMLEQIGLESFETETIWTEGLQQFEGVPLDALMDALGVTQGTLTATALNDYSVELPVIDTEGDGPIIAFRQNGELMSVRDKGPLWIIYPFDSNPAYKSETIFARSIWQLDRIGVRQ